MAGTQVASVFVAIGAKLDGLNQGLATAQGKLQSVGQSMTSTGRSMTRNVTLPLLGMGTAAAMTGIQYESAFAGVIKTTTGLRDEFGELTELGEELRQGFRDMALEIPTSAAALAGIGEAAGQLGIKAENILGFTRVMADLGETTNLSGEEAAMALAQLANVTGMSQEDFDRLGSVIVELGNNFATTERDIVNMASRISAAGTIVGMSESDIMAYAAALSSVGINAEAGGSAISRVFIDIANAVASGGEGLTQFAAVAGMSTEEFASAFEEDAAGAVGTFIQGLHGIDESGGNIFQTLDDLGFSSLRVRETLLKAANASNLLDDALASGNAAWQANTALSTEAGVRYETTAAQLNILLNALKDLGITFADIILPVLNDLLPYLQDAIKWFAGVPEPVKKIIVIVAALAVVIGPLLVVLGSLITTIGAISGVVATVGPLLGGIGVVIGVILSPIGLLVAAIIALAVLIAIKGPEIWVTIQQMVGIVIGAFLLAKQAIIDFVERGKQALAEFVLNIQERAAAIRDYLSGLAGNMVQAGRDLISGLIDGVQQMAQGLIDSVTGVVQGAIDGARRLLGLNSPSKVFSNIGANVTAGMQRGIESGAHKLLQTVNALAQQTAGAGALFGGVAKTGRGVPNLGSPALPLARPPGGGGGPTTFISININEPLTISDPRQIDQMADAIAKRLNLRGGYRIAYRRAMT